MATSYESVVTGLATQWRSLRAWRAPLPALVVIDEYKDGDRLGFAKHKDRSAHILLTGRSDRSLARDLTTALHELAHLAAPTFIKHELPWRELYVAGVVEALGLPSFEANGFELDVQITALDAQVTHAVWGWLNRTGQTSVLCAIGALVKK